MKSYIISVLLFVMTGAALAEPDVRCPFTNYPLPIGNEQADAPVVLPPYIEPIRLDEVDLIGDTITIGTTWREGQHPGTIGRMVDKDSSGYLHFTWQNNLSSGGMNPWIYYANLSPSGQISVQAVALGSCPVLDVGFSSIATIAFNGTDGLEIATSHGDSFIVSLSGSQTSWPQAKWGNGIPSRYHVITMENLGMAGSPQHQFYNWGAYNLQTFSVSMNLTWIQFEPTQTIAYTVATSRNTNKVAVAWTHCREPGYPGQPGQTWTQRNNDVYLVIDDDGLNISFANPINVTNFIPPDTTLLPDTLLADRDTLRAYTDLCVFIDHNNYVHAAFTTAAYFSFEQSTYWNASIIWHWSSQFPDTFKMIANAFNPNDVVGCGAWQLKAQRPSLGEGPAPDYKLYCMYHQYDTDSSHLSAAGFPSGEVYVSVSTNNGLSWSQGTNITNTLTPQNAPPGTCLSEYCPNMTERVDSYCHVMYVLDKDAGNIGQTEGAWTLNPVKYHKVATNQIPTTPLLQQIYNLHVNPVGPLPPVTVTLTPFGTPIIIPAQGGSFNFNVAVTNTTSQQQITDGWGMIRLPNGELYGPVLGPIQDLTMPSNYSLNRNRSQYIPDYAPAGTYRYIAAVGNYIGWQNWTITDADSFLFVKSGGVVTPDTLWTHTYGGSSSDSGTYVQQASDGGFIIVGKTQSFGAGGNDVYLLKTNAIGTLQWSHTYGGGNHDKGYCVRQTSDGGYIIVGETFSYGAGGSDVYLIKTDSLGIQQWYRTFGGNANEQGFDVWPTTDGGYILVGLTWSYGAGYRDAYLIKTDGSGNLQWSHTYGGSYYDDGRSVRQTPDGGYVIAGQTSTDFTVGSFNVYLFKTDGAGNPTWSRTFGGSSEDRGMDMEVTTDGGYIIGGFTSSFGAGSKDVYLIKTNSLGILQWDETYGEAEQDEGYGVEQTADGGYVLSGWTNSSGAGEFDMYFVRTNSSGNLLWDKTVGGSNSESGNGVLQTADGRFLAAGWTQSYGAGSYDVYLVCLEPETMGDWLPGAPPEVCMNATPQDYAFRQNYPNPFNATTTISFALPQASWVNLAVYDVSGRQVAELVQDWREAGNHEVIFDGSKLTSGLYLYTLKAGTYSASGKMVLLK